MLRKGTHVICKATRNIYIEEHHTSQLNKKDEKKLKNAIQNNFSTKTIQQKS